MLKKKKKEKTMFATKGLKLNIHKRKVDGKSFNYEIKNLYFQIVFNELTERDDN